MTWAKVISKIQLDLNVPGKRAAAYVEEFRKKFDGFKESITEVEASYTIEGYIKIRYKINERYNSMIIKNKKKL